MAGQDFKINVVIDPKIAVTGTNVVEERLIRLERRAEILRSTLLRAFGIFGGGALLANTIRTMTTFEQSMANVAAVTGATEDQFESLREKAIELGIATRFTATEAAESLANMARAGFTVNETLVSVSSTLVLAQAGGLGLAEAANIAVSALRGFRLRADEAARVSDVLSLTANRTNTSVTELGEGIKFVAPVAAGLGVSLELATAAMGTLSDSGLKATIAGTGLRRVLAELESPTLASAKIMRSFGVNTDEVRVSQVGLITALERLKEAGISTGQALQIFGDRGGPAFEVLSSNLPRIRELQEELQNAAGSATRTAKVMDDNLNGALLRMKSAFEGLILSIGGSGATGALRSAFENIAVALRQLAANSDLLVQAGTNLAIILGPKYLLGAIRLLGVAIAANPLGLFLTAAALVIAMVPDLQAQFDALRGTIEQLGQVIAETIDFQAVLVSIASFIDTSIAFFRGFLNATATIFYALSQQPEAATELMLKAFRDAIEAILDLFFAFAQTIGDLTIGIGSDFVSLARNVGGAIGAISSGNLDAAQAFADNLESTLLRSANRVATFTGTLSGNLKKLRDSELLPEVELSGQAFDLGRIVSNEFQRGLAESTPGAQVALEKLLASPADMAAEAARKAKELELPDPTRGQPGMSGANRGLSPDAANLLVEIDYKTQLADKERYLNEILERRPDLLEEVNKAAIEASIQGLEASNQFADGWTRAFLKLQQEAANFATVAESLVNTFADRATDALTEFATTGQFNFKQFANALLSDIARIIARLLVVQALSAIFGGGGAGVLAGQAGVQIAGARADGGPVASGRSYLVGENGPELFTPKQGGNITPNNQLAAGGGAAVNLQVVNVDDPNKVPQAIASGIADQAIINVLGRNREVVRQAMS